MLMQAADAAKSSSTIFLDGMAIMALISAGGIAAREYFRAKKSKKSENGDGQKPGVAPECLKHRDELIRIDQIQKDTKEDIVEIKGDVKELLRRVPINDQ